MLWSVHQECLWRMEAFWALGLGEAPFLLFTLCFCSFLIKKKSKWMCYFFYLKLFLKKGFLCGQRERLCARVSAVREMKTRGSELIPVCPSSESWDFQRDLTGMTQPGNATTEFPEVTFHFRSPEKQFGEMVRNGYLLCFQKQDGDAAGGGGGKL